MSDIRKLLNIINETSAGSTSTGSVAPMAQSFNTEQRRVEEEKTPSPEVIEYGMWENSALTTSSKLKKSRGKSSKVVKSIYGEDVSEAANPQQQAAIAIAKKEKKDVSEGRFVKGPGGVPLDRHGNPKLPKPVAPKPTAAPKLSLDDVWRKIENVCSQIAPDGDPIDWLAPWLAKHGIRDFKIGEVLDRAAKKNGYKDLYDYYDEIKSYADGQGVAEGSEDDDVSKTAYMYGIKHGREGVGNNMDRAKAEWGDNFKHYNAGFMKGRNEKAKGLKAVGQGYGKKQQGVAEGKYDPAKDTFNPETHAAITKDGVDKLIPKSQLAKYKEQGWKERHSLKAFHKNREKQGVAEGSIKSPQQQLADAEQKLMDIIRKANGEPPANDAEAKERQALFNKIKRLRTQVAGSRFESAEQGVAEGSLTEMDKSSPQPGRDGKVSHKTYGSRDNYKLGDPERMAKQVSAEKAKKDALDILKKQGVAEGTEELDESDLILNPASISKAVRGLVPHSSDRTDHEIEMAKSDLYQAGKNAVRVYELIKDRSEEEGLEGWVQEKITKAADYLNTISEYLEGKQLESMDGVSPSTKMFTSEGEMEEGKTGPGLWANIHAKRERIKKGSGERMRKPGSKGAPTAANLKSAQAGTKK